MEEYISRTEKDTEEIGAIAATLCKNPDFVALYGDMGSGKTVFMRGFAGALIPNVRVTSPTYAILNVYEGENIQINHFDMYRITSEEDLLSTGFEDVLDQGVTVCEWSENITEFIPESHLRIVFEKLDDLTRRITIERVGK